MVFFSFVYRYGIWISVPLFALGVILLVTCITGVIRLSREARLFSVPLISRQEIEFKNAGRFVLCMEGPILSRRFSGLKYEITGHDGTPVEGRPVLFRAHTTGFSKARMELRVYRVDQPGRYTFQIQGLGEERTADAKHAMVFTRPHLGHSILYVIGTILTSGITIGSIILFFLRLLNVE